MRIEDGESRDWRVLGGPAAGGITTRRFARPCPYFDLDVERVGGATDADGMSRRGAVGIVRAQGEVDLATAGRLHGSLEPILWSDCTGVLVDLSRVTFMDSAGINTLIRAQHDLTSAGADLAVRAAPHSQVEHLLELTGLRRRIPASLQASPL